MADLKKYLGLKKAVADAQQRFDKASGAMSQILRQLKADFGCDSLEEAEKKLKLLKKQEDESQEEFDEAVEAFEKKHGKILE